MNTFESSATVGTHGEIHLVGLPFLPGTEVEIVVSAKQSDSANGRAAALLTALDRARNAEPVGPLRREDLYDRGSAR
ncbi:MAG: hypothetical protein AB7I57_19515 [Pirellulales bacterium]